MKNFRKVTALLLALALCFAISACGQQQAKPESGKGADLSNTLVYAGENESTINPVLTNHDELTDIIFSGLMKFDGHGKPVPDLAESYDFNPDTLTYTFKLRQGIKWHDGKEFTAEDVVFTYKTLTEDKTLSSSIRSDYEDIVKIEAPDAHTVVITLGKYDAAMLCYFTVGIIPKHLLEGQEMNTTSFNQHPVGTGRYKFESWDTAGGMITLVRNEDFYGKVPNIERLIYKTVAVESTKATMLQSGEADLAWLNANYAATFAGKEGYKSWNFTTADYRGASMDMSSKFWSQNSDSIGVLNYALDKEAIARSLMVEPKLIIADEPVASLDISIQAQIITLFQDLQKEHGFSLLFIAHDLNVVRYISHRVGVMYRGKLVETAPVQELFANPLHPYTKSLLSAIHVADPIAERQRKILDFDPEIPLGTIQKEHSPGHFLLGTA